MPTASDRSPLKAPAVLELVLDFVNSHSDGSGRPERFANAVGFQQWIEEARLDGAAATDADAASARELRDALVTVLLAHSGADTGETLGDAESYLSVVAARYPLVSVVCAEGVSLKSAQAGVPGILGSVLAGVTELAQSGAWSRVKACRNEPCHFGFFDRTRNGSAVYCSSGCNSQASMRAYRERKKSATAR